MDRRRLAPKMVCKGSLKTQRITKSKSSLKTQMERQRLVAKMVCKGSLKTP